MRLILALLLMLPTLLLAAPPSEAWRVVVGVAADDVLNLRATPDAEAEVLGALEPGALVVATGETRMNGRTEWAEIAEGERRMWAAARFLAPADLRRIEGSQTPVAGRCGGFEPMWSLRWTESEIEFHRIDAAPETRPLDRAIPAEGRIWVMLQAGGDPADRWLFRYEDEVCTDLPVEQPGWGRGALIVTRDGRTSWLTACCRPAPEAASAP